MLNIALMDVDDFALERDDGDGNSHFIFYIKKTYIIKYQRNEKWFVELEEISRR